MIKAETPDVALPPTMLWCRLLVRGDTDSQLFQSLLFFPVNFRDQRLFALNLLIHSGRSWEMPYSLTHAPTTLVQILRGVQLSRTFECSLQHPCELNCCTSQVLPIL
jgi:hypothetical protein